MIPRIETISEKKLIGICLTMSFIDNKVSELWKKFMPRRKEITNNLSNNLFALVIYQPNHFADYKPDNKLVRWAALEVANFENVPTEMKTLALPSGQYVVCMHKGDANQFKETSRYIFETWLPNSNYVVDDRPHFEVLGEKYQNNNPNSEEEIWIPIKLKQLP